jgi:uncharacterized membrane protein
MSREPTPAEAEALAASSNLVKFAAETVKDIPAETVATIYSALDAATTERWNQEIAAKFWPAYNSLCSLIKPVTVEALLVNRTDGARLSLAKLTSQRYLRLLYALLVIAVIVGFATTTASALAKEIRDLVDAGNKVTDQIVELADRLEATVGRREFSEVTDPEAKKIIAQLQSRLQEQYYLLDKIAPKTNTETRLASFGWTGFPYGLGRLQPVADLVGVSAEVNNYQVTRRDVETQLASDSIAIGLLNSSVLPIILGLMGACAYIVRLISDQIRDTTFSPTSPTRHRVRLALGGLAGVVIGYGGVAQSAGLSPAALAFIAGYAVEPVFATLDGIAARFR